MVLVGMRDDHVVDLVRRSEVSGYRGEDRRRAHIATVHDMHGPVLAELVSDRDCVTTPCRIDLQKIN